MCILQERAAIISKIVEHQDLRVKTAAQVRRALDYALDGAESFEELEAVEKSIIGIKIEKYWLRQFDFPMKKTKQKLERLTRENPGQVFQNTLLDTEIANVPVDLKHTIGDNWMVPLEAVGHWLLLFQTNMEGKTFNLGLFKADPENLTKGGNQDKKVNICASAKETITWIIKDEPIPERPA
jgi:hypothetical protein